jgi:hypothetical protein
VFTQAALDQFLTRSGFPGVVQVADAKTAKPAKTAKKAKADKPAEADEAEEAEDES